MALAGLGRPWELWRLPFHTFVNIRDEYLGILNPPKETEEGVETTTIAPGVTFEERKRP